MPAKNVIKQLVPDSFYHVYNRGVAKQKIFLDQSDKRYFLSLLDRHLNPHSKITDKFGVPYRKFKNLELNCFCLMGNHYHFLVYTLQDPDELTEFMRSIGTAYTMYFNLKYSRVGPLFQGRYKASRITNDEYLLHITRYIHLNPRNYATYKYSSYPSYIDDVTPPWLTIDRVSELFYPNEYQQFVSDYEDYADTLETIKYELADR